jgi:hypothetical protein
MIHWIITHGDLVFGAWVFAASAFEHWLHRGRKGRV